MLMLFATVALVHLIALMSHGPDFFFVLQTAASRSRRQAMYGVIGITTLGGGLYLCWMGWQLLRAARRQALADANPRPLPLKAAVSIVFYAVCSPTWPIPRRLSISAAYFRSLSAIISAPASALGYLP